MVWALVAHGVSGSTGVSSVHGLGRFDMWPVVEVLDRLADGPQRAVDGRELVIEADGVLDIGPKPRQLGAGQ